MNKNVFLTVVSGVNNLKSGMYLNVDALQVEPAGVSQGHGRKPIEYFF